ncbi:Wzy polymerase domain-containing protein [Enterobacter asburiae]|uniref:PglL family O-oligosaccharyltransferase n=1 Tax=Enterobacter asburiae TaxID=61645 RepID=UPI00159ED562|nr:Wzy polymerase domain-containing protein [Enterobacter asburiae]MDE4034255.1 Wzy polymerase domain-containing protein [Enterobacter asburiae]MDE4066932.1 Wzy polymerase domain-containing protein [Enterobacter asburiae]MDE4070716.1 Wzy polymerase domain-containing protein [Enterobacter asburiae]
MLILWGYFVFALVIYIPNMGGGGLRLPQNILCWVAMQLIILMGGFYALSHKQLKWNLPLLAFTAGAALMMVPFLWSGQEAFLYALPRFAGLWGGILFYLALLQIPLQPSHKKQLVILLIVSAGLQSLLACWQLRVITPDNLMEFMPGMRPYGIFQQTNVLASFIATGFACVVWLLFKVKSWRGAITLLMLSAVFAGLLDLLQSRAGIVGMLVYTLFICIVRYRPRLRGVFTAWIAVVAVTLSVIHLLKFYGLGGQFLQLLGTVNKEGTNTERVIILKATYQMILEHPLSGWGYGSYEFNLPRVALDHFHHIFGQNIDHAHNEVLFEWAEGGMFAVVGMMCIAAGYLSLFRRYAPCKKALWGLAIPIAFHLMVEYPLLLSVPHWMTLLLICRLTTPERMASVNDRRSGAGWLLPVTALMGLLFMVTGLQTGTTLTQFERGKMQDFTAASRVVNPWIQWDRWQYDKHTALLMRYNQTRNIALLEEYARWAIVYLQHKNDFRVYLGLAQINRMLPETSRSQWLKDAWNTYYRGAAGIEQQDKRLLQ